MKTEQELIDATARGQLSLKGIVYPYGITDLENVKRYGILSIPAKNQTEAICIAAVERDGEALGYVEEQTEAICLAAVRKRGRVLKYAKEQTEAICLAAVKQDGLALQYVKDNGLRNVLKLML